VRKADTEVSVAQKRLQETMHKIPAMEKMQHKLCPTCLQKVGDEHIKRCIAQLIKEVECLKIQWYEAKARLSFTKPVISDGGKEVADSSDSVKKHQSALDNAKKLLTKLTADLRANRESVQQWKSLIASKKKALSIARLKLVSQRMQADKLRQKDKDLRFWETAFGPRGIRSYRLDQLTPRMNTIALKYSNDVFGDGTRVEYSTQTQLRSGEMRDNFDVRVIGPDGEKKDVLSAGQAQRRDLIHTFTMVDLAEELGKRTVDLLVFDEAFRSIDARGTDVVVRLLKEKSKSVKTILVIEHGDEVLGRFDQTLVATRKGGKATFALEAADH
jgi:DNA repair exonuclease SbcCD ATPase subunit